MEYSYKFDNGKYEIVHNDERGTSHCYRYGKEWRDLTGDKLIGEMLHEIRELNEEIESLNYQLDQYYDGDGLD